MGNQHLHFYEIINTYERIIYYIHSYVYNVCIQYICICMYYIRIKKLKNILKKDTVPSVFPVYSFKMRVLQGRHFIIFLCVHHLFVSECIQVWKKRWIMNKLTHAFMQSINKSVWEKKNGYFTKNVLKMDRELRNPHPFLPRWMT